MAALQKNKYLQPATTSWSMAKICALLAVITFLLYANTLQNGYVLDDATVTTQNTIVTQGFAGIPELLTTPRLKGYEPARDLGSYRPIPLITSAIEYQLFGDNAAAGHFFNILFFIGCVISFFLFLRKLAGNAGTGVAFIAALLFAVHPIHTEVVANIKSRDELLCFLFAFMSLNIFTSYARNGRIMSLLAGTVLLFLAYLSKETIIAFIFIVPLIFFCYINEHKQRSALITACTLLATVTFLLIRHAVLGTGETAIVFISNPLIATDTATRIATAFVGLGIYLKLLLIPYPLISDYSYNTIPIAGFGNIYVLLTLGAYTLLAITAFYRLVTRRKDLWAFSILFFLATIALFSNIPFLIYSQFAERFLFFASAGFCIAVALAYQKWHTAPVPGVQLTQHKPAFATLISVCLILGALTFMRNNDWKDNYTLFSTDVKKAPDNAYLNYYMASSIAQSDEISSQQEKDQLTIGYLNRSLAIYPDFDNAHQFLGAIYDRLQMFDSAITHDLRALAVNPRNSIATYNLARAYYFQKKYPEAITAFKKTIELQPGVMLTYLNLALCSYDNQEYDSAIVYFNKTLAIDPTQQIALQRLKMAQDMKVQMDTTGQNNTGVKK